MSKLWRTSQNNSLVCTEDYSAFPATVCVLPCYVIPLERWGAYRSSQELNLRGPPYHHHPPSQTIYCISTKHICKCCWDKRTTLVSKRKQSGLKQLREHKFLFAAQLQDQMCLSELQTANRYHLVMTSLHHGGNGSVEPVVSDSQCCAALVHTFIFQNKCKCYSSSSRKHIYTVGNSEINKVV